MVSRTTGTFASLQNNDYRRLWSGSMLATTAFMMSFMLVPSVAFEITGSNASAGLAQMGSGIGMFVVSPIGGVIADRFHKKPLVLVGQCLPALVILAVGILIVTDRITVPILTLGTLVMGLGFSFMGPARQAWVSELVPRSSLPNAIALQQLAQNIARSGLRCSSPSWSATSSASAGPTSSCLGVPGGAAAHPVAAEHPTVRRRASGAADRAGGGHQLRLARPTTPDPVARLHRHRGLRLRLSNPPARVVGAGARPRVDRDRTRLPGAGDRRPGREPPTGRHRWHPMGRAALVAMGLIMAGGFAIVALSSSYAVLLVSAIPLGVGRSGFMLVDNALLMSHADPSYHGRVMSLAMMGFGTQSLLAPVWGALADAIGVRQTLGLVGVVALIITAIVGLSWFQALRQVDDVEPGSAAHPLGLTTVAAMDGDTSEPRTVVSLHAHPDDEVMLTGELLAKANAEGLRTVVVYGSRGDAGKTGLELGHQTLGQRREAEAREACAVLGVDRVEFLDHLDSGMAGDPENDHPDAFSRADPEEVAIRVAELLADEHLLAVVGYDANGTYGHPDHIQVYRVAHALAAQMAVPWLLDATYNREYLADLPGADGSLDPGFASAEADLTHFVQGEAWFRAKMDG